MREINKIDSLLVMSECSIRDALLVINENQLGLCFVVESERLVGVLSDGDIRRYLLEFGKLEDRVIHAMNKNYLALRVDASDDVIRRAFSDGIKLIPLLNNTGSVVDVADVKKSHRIPVLEPELCGNELEYIVDCVKSNWISSQGKYVIQFEEMFTNFHQVNNSIAVSNGTTALHLALIALGIGPGDEVIVPNLTFAASANAVIYCGATPVLCEIESKTWCIDVSEARKLIGPKTKAIMPVHLYGHPVNMDLLMDLAQEKKLLVIEDCAESLGTKWKGKLVGTFGNAATFSFFGNKTISTGEGGMIIFKDNQIAKNAKILRDHGMSRDKRYWHDVVGFNYRLTNLQSAIGVAQMERIDSILARKKSIAEMYSKELGNLYGIKNLPNSDENTDHSNWLFTIILDSMKLRDFLISELIEYGIESRPVFFPLDIMPPYLNLKSSMSLKNSHNISNCGLSLPTSVTLTDDEIIYVSNTVKEILTKYYKLKGVGE